ncbi:MAG TPA: hypothetical protein DCM28_10710 [Phycisphaerales bacterium]|nr:hypothetical protein [Phycisphaerales bacterium]
MTMAISNSFKWPLQTYPQITNAGHFPLSDRDYAVAYQSPTHALHLHEYDGHIDMNGRLLCLSPGTVTLSAAKGITRYDVTIPGRHWCIHFQTAHRSKQNVSVPLHLPNHHSQIDITGRMAHIASLHASPKDEIIAHSAASHALQELLLLLAYRWPQNIKQTAGTQANQAVDRLLQIIHRGLDQTLRVSELTHEVQLSQNYLAMHFRQRMGMTIPNYILQARIKRAQLLLKTTNLPIKQIGAQVGIPDPQHFNKQFRRVTGQSPTEHRLV